MKKMFLKYYKPAIILYFISVPCILAPLFWSLILHPVSAYEVLFPNKWEVISTIIFAASVMTFGCLLVRVKQNDYDISKLTVMVPIILGLQLISEIIRIGVKVDLLSMLKGGNFISAFVGDDFLSIMLTLWPLFNLGILAFISILCISIGLIFKITNKNDKVLKRYLVMIFMLYSMNSMTFCGILPMCLHLFSFVSVMDNFDMPMLFSFLGAFMQSLAYIAFFASLMVFGWRSQNVYFVVGLGNLDVIMKNMKPQKALSYLKDGFDMGLISEEEYQMRKEEILSKI